MKEILYDSKDFPKLNKKLQTKYIATVMDRMENSIGKKNTKNVLFSCGVQCCGKSWSNFVNDIWKKSESIEEFIKNLNKAEEKYSTCFSFDRINNSISVYRKKCICGLINKGNHFDGNANYCNCSIGHMSKFFNSVLPIDNITLKQTIFNGNDKCEWEIKIIKQE